MRLQLAQSPLDAAVDAGNIDVVAMLVDAAPDTVLFANKACETPLYLAAHRGYAKIVRILLDVGGDIGKRALRQGTKVRALKQ